MGDRTNDHEINVGGTKRSLRLLRKRDSKGNEGAAYYTITEDIPKYANPLSFKQSDWSGGHGQYALEDPTRYMLGQNIDTTLRGKITAAPLRDILASVYHLVDAAVADDGGVMTTETTAAINSTANDMHLLPAVPAVNDAFYFLFDPVAASGTHTLLLNITTAGVGTWTFAWEHWNGSAYVAVTGLTDNTVAFTASGYKTVLFTTTNWASTTVNSIAGYPLRARVATYSAVTTQPLGGQAWLDSTDMAANPVATSWYKTTDSLFCATATKVFEYDSTNTRWIERVEFAGQTITDLAEHDSILYVALGNSTKWYYSTNGYAYTISALTDGYAQRFLVAPNESGTADRLWFYQTPNELMNTSDGRTVEASTPAYIGDTSYNITNIFLCNDRIMVGKENGLWHYDSIGGQHALMTELQHNRSTVNFKYVAYYKGATYFSLIRNIGEITASDYVNVVGPLKEADSSLVKVGDIVGLASDEDFLYVAIDEGTNTIVYKGHQVIGSDGALRWSWCPIQTLSTNACSIITMTQVSRTSGHLGNLWVGYGNELAFIPQSPNPAAESTIYYTTAIYESYLRTSYFYGTNPFWDKLWQSIVIETAGCSSTRRIAVKYLDDNDTSSSTLIDEFYTNGVQEIKFSSALNNKRIAFEFYCVADYTTTAPPEILYFEAKGIEVPEVTKVHECIYEVGDASELKAKTLMDFLDSARTSTSLVKFADLRRGQKTTGTTTGDYVWVIMQPGYPKFVETSDEAGRHPEMGIQVRWQEVDFTIS